MQQWNGHTVSREAIRHGNGHACKSSFLEHRGPVKGLSLGTVEMSSLFKDLVPKSPSRGASNAVQISFHTHLHSGDTRQKQPLRSELTGQWGGEQILRVKSPRQGPTHPASFFSQETQSKQKQSMCLKQNYRKVTYLPCWFSLSSSGCKVQKFHLLSFIKARTVYEETRTRPPSNNTGWQGRATANMQAYELSEKHNTACAQTHMHMHTDVHRNTCTQIHVLKGLEKP